MIPAHITLYYHSIASAILGQPSIHGFIINHTSFLDPIYYPLLFRLCLFRKMVHVLRVHIGILGRAIRRSGYAPRSEMVLCYVVICSLHGAPRMHLGCETDLTLHICLPSQMMIVQGFF